MPTTGLYAWSQTAADNAAADTEINWTEQQNPDTVNNSARAMMRRLAQFARDLAPTRASTGSANAFLVTAASNPTQYADGFMVAFRSNMNVTDVCTININGWGAKAFRPAVGREFRRNDIKIGTPITAYYDSASDSVLALGSGFYVNELFTELHSAAPYNSILSAGFISIWPTESIPNGWLEANGAAISRATYPQLFTAYGTRYGIGDGVTSFNLPDYRGETLRGWDHGKGSDPDAAARTNRGDGTTGDVPGAKQASQIGQHAHGPGTIGGTTGNDAPDHTHTTPPFGLPGSSGTTGGGGISQNSGTGTTTGLTRHQHPFTATTGTTANAGGTESRGRNVGVVYCVLADPAAVVASTFGLVGLQYRFDDGTSNADPGTGRVRLNNATFASVTEAYLSKSDALGVSNSAWLDWLTLVLPGAIKLSAAGNPSQTFFARVAAIDRTPANHVRLTLTGLGVSGTFANNANLTVEGATSGIQGPQGTVTPALQSLADASANSATASAASASVAAASASSASSSATVATTQASAATAAASASGSVLFYNTKALADAALSGLPANQIVEILIDESRGGTRTRYRKEGGVYVYKITLSNETNRFVAGTEYLYQWLTALTAGTAVKSVFSGDSTVIGLSGSLGPLLTQRYGNVTIVTNSFSGEHTGQWNATRLATDIAAVPNLLIWHWGMNDCSGLSRTPAQFETDLRAGLTTFRGSYPLATCGVVLMTPNAAGDDATGRNEAQAAQLRPIIRRAATDFKCAYFDTSGIYNDGTVGGNTSWLDVNLVHPQSAQNNAISGELLDLILPAGMRLAVEGIGVGNQASTATGGSPALSAAPSAYPRGISIKRATAANGWLRDGGVETHFYLENTFPFQINWPYSGSARPLIRTYDQEGAAWNTWSVFGNGWDLPGTNAIAADAASVYTAGGTVQRAQLSDGWPLDGYVQTTRIGSTAIQTNWAYGSTVPVRVRNYNQGTSTWGAWREIGGALAATAVTAASGFAAPGSDGMVSIVQGNGLILGDGYLDVSTPGTIAAGTLIATLPAGHYPISSWRTVYVECWTGGATGTGSSWVRGRVQISPSTGQVTLLDAIAVSVSRVYFASGSAWRQS